MKLLITVLLVLAGFVSFAQEGNPELFIKQNRAKEQIVVSYRGNYCEKKLNITDAAGKVVFSRNMGKGQKGQIAIQVTNMPKGLYTVTFDENSKVTTKTISVL